jgi:hypothetical protein
MTLSFLGNETGWTDFMLLMRNLPVWVEMRGEYWPGPGVYFTGNNILGDTVGGRETLGIGRVED